MEETRGITVKVAADLHSKVKSEQELMEITMSQYITMVLDEHFDKKGGRSMDGTRTLAFQVDEELFQRVKAHLARNPGLKQKDFVISLIEAALNEAEAMLQQEAPCEANGPSDELNEQLTGTESSESAYDAEIE